MICQTVKAHGPDVIFGRDSVSCLADLRRVPFFSGDGHRHRKINKLLSDREIPVFHVGAGYFLAINQNLPTSIKFAELVDLLENAERVHDTVVTNLGRGACLLILDDDPDVIALAKMIVSLISSKFENAQVKLNRTWSHISGVETT